MSTLPISTLRNCYVGQACTVVGKGPSLLHLTREQISAGPIIALNESILKVLTLDLSNDIFSMQKDGGDKSCCALPCRNICGGMRRLPDEVALLVHVHESPQCYVDHALRYVFNNPLDFNLGIHSASLPTAIKIAELMGCRGITLVSMDAATTQDLRVTLDGKTVQADNPGGQRYLKFAQHARDLLARANFERVEWLTPQ